MQPPPALVLREHVVEPEDVEDDAGDVELRGLVVLMQEEQAEQRLGRTAVEVFERRARGREILCRGRIAGFGIRVDVVEDLLEQERLILLKLA